jgi:tRNA threonylcarbamoyladenosine biosynthesis protein TsaE
VSGLTEAGPLFLPDETATHAFAARLAKALKPGLILYLSGDLGAGKTTLVRALLHALGHTGRVKSPTYTLLEQYTAGELNFCHFDLYRFNSEEEWETTGFRDEFNGHNICLIEWPEKARGFIPDADVEILLDILPDGRNLTLRAHSKNGRACLNVLQS